MSLKPKVAHPALEKNKIGLTRRDYEGGVSSLCGGCGHDSVTAAIIQAFYELAMPPHLVCKMSGIGCSSKTPGYFLSQAHGVNSVHGRMPSIALGANAAHRGLCYIGVSGDGDTGSIGIGQYLHAVRRRLNMLYMIENNGVYGLTKGQFSALADLGAKSKGGEANKYPGIDPLILAINAGASFVARGFSGDKEQLVPMIKAGLKTPGFAVIDIVSPCVTFNNHAGSTRSYSYAREHHEDFNLVDLITAQDEITMATHALEDNRVAAKNGEGKKVVRMHDGSLLVLSKIAQDVDLSDRAAAVQRIMAAQELSEQERHLVTGILYLDREPHDHHAILGTTERPLRDLPYSELCPGSGVLHEFNLSKR